MVMLEGQVSAHTTGAVGSHSLLCPGRNWGVACHAQWHFNSFLLALRIKPATFRLQAWVLSKDSKTQTV